MIIICPNCHASFAVPEEVIPEHGRNVKCSKCSNIWYVKKLVEDNQEVVEAQSLHGDLKGNDSEPEEENKNLPALQENETNLQWIFSAFGLIVAIIFATFILYFNALIHNDTGSKLIQALGYSDTKNFAIQDIRIRTNKYSGKYSLFLKYRIYNNSSRNQPTPWVRIQFFDSDNKLFYTHIGTNSRFKFQPFQIVPTKAEFNELTREVDRIEITLGNKIELYTR